MRTIPLYVEAFDVIFINGIPALGLAITGVRFPGRVFQKWQKNRGRLELKT